MTEKKLSTLVINQIESIDVYNLLKTQGKINQDELYLISGEPDIITGVKGNKETTYRTGNINLTPADIGALPDTTEIPTVPTKVSAFENDAGYLTQHQSLTDYPKKTELANVATSGDYTDLINTPTIPSTEGLATETYVQNKIAEVVNSAPGTLDTLNELAQALGNDPNFATTMVTELGKKANTANLATVATSGSYNDLSDTPTIPSPSGAYVGSYTGDGSLNKTLTFNFKPAVVMIAGDPDGPSSAIGIYGFKYLMNDRNSSTVSWTNNSFTITLNQYSMIAYNSNNVTYYYIAIPAMN